MMGFVRKSVHLISPHFTSNLGPAASLWSTCAGSAAQRLKAPLTLKQLCARCILDSLDLLLFWFVLAISAIIVLLFWFYVVASGVFLVPTCRTYLLILSDGLSFPFQGLNQNSKHPHSSENGAGPSQLARQGTESHS